MHAYIIINDNHKAKVKIFLCCRNTRSQFAFSFPPGLWPVLAVFLCPLSLRLAGLICFLLECPASRLRLIQGSGSLLRSYTLFYAGLIFPAWPIRAACPVALCGACVPWCDCMISCLFKVVKRFCKYFYLFFGARQSVPNYYYICACSLPRVYLK